MSRDRAKAHPRRALLLAHVCFVVSCYTGPITREFRPARTAHGTQAEVRVGRRQLTGELLEVRDTAFVLLTSDRLLLVPFSAVREARFPYLGAYKPAERRPELEDRLRLLSRFPFGIPAAALEALLAELRQSLPLVVRE